MFQTTQHETILDLHQKVDPYLFTKEGIVNITQRAADDGSLTPTSAWAAKMLRLALTACRAFGVHPDVALNYELQRITPALDVGEIPDLNPSIRPTPSTLIINEQSTAA